jgi:2,4-dienoyl-CoA reductase-like NADH-dependent reductase (Old Yellow Enzyme family)
MANLFETTTINAMTLRSRFVRSATWEGLAGDDGSVSRRLIDMSVSLTKGGVSLIITGHAYISKEGQEFRVNVVGEQPLIALKSSTT